MMFFNSCSVELIRRPFLPETRAALPFGLRSAYGGLRDDRQEAKQT
jgi:hypothetical protein